MTSNDRKILFGFFHQLLFDFMLGRQDAQKSCFLKVLGPLM